MKVLNVFNTLTLIQVFSKTKTFLKKLKYLFLVETIKIQNASFPFKTVLSEDFINHLSESSYCKHSNLTFEFKTQLDREGNKSLFLIFIFFRHNVTFKTVVGESNSIQPEMVASWFKTTLPTLLSNCKLNYKL